MDLGTVEVRNKLKARPEPYWHRLAKGQFLGFRRSRVRKGGTWIARFNDPDTGKKPTRSLGDFGHLPPSDQFTAASKQAREWFTHLAGGGEADVLTVEEACRRYAKNKPEAEQRFIRHVYGDPVAKVSLDKLASRHISEWRKRLEAKPAVLAKRSDGESPTRPRSSASVNRDMVPLRAALNKARDDGYVLTDTAWRVALTPATANNRRTLYLNREERTALLNALPADAAAFCRGLCQLPVRPGALAELCVRDFNSNTHELTIRNDKGGAWRRIVLPDETSAFFKAQKRDKLPAAYLFTSADGKQWNKNTWKGPIKAAVKVANLPKETVAYTLRHSTITDLVVGGLDLFTVAQVAGTSVRMIEKYYGQLQHEHAKEALSKLVL